MPNATLTDQWNLGTDTVFQRRVQESICAAAVAIQSEATSAANHANRANYAKLVLNNSQSYALQLAAGIATDSTIALQAGSPYNQATVTDAAINNAVSAMWNAFAGTI